MNREEFSPETQERQARFEAREARKAKRRRALLIVACLLFLIVDVAVFAVFGMSVQKDIEEIQEIEEEREAQEEKLGVTQEMTEEEREEYIAQILGQAHRNVTLRSVMQAWDGKADVYLSNKEESPCGVALHLTLMETGEVIAQTDVLDPGWHIISTKLSRELEPGEYRCLAECLFYTTDDMAYLGSTARQVLLTVK